MGVFFCAEIMTVHRTFLHFLCIRVRLDESVHEPFRKLYTRVMVIVKDSTMPCIRTILKSPNMGHNGFMIKDINPENESNKYKMKTQEIAFLTDIIESIKKNRTVSDKSIKNDKGVLIKTTKKEGKIMKNKDEHINCSICGVEMTEPFTNNPYPVIEDEEARCCSSCNWEYVIPARQGVKISDKVKATFHINNNNRK